MSVCLCVTRPPIPTALNRPASLKILFKNTYVSKFHARIPSPAPPPPHLSIYLSIVLSLSLLHAPNTVQWTNSFAFGCGPRRSSLCCAPPAPPAELQGRRCVGRDRLHGSCPCQPTGTRSHYQATRAQLSTRTGR